MPVQARPPYAEAISAACTAADHFAIHGHIESEAIDFAVVVSGLGQIDVPVEPTQAAKIAKIARKTVTATSDSRWMGVWELEPSAVCLKGSGER